MDENQGFSGWVAALEHPNAQSGLWNVDKPLGDVQTKVPPQLLLGVAGGCDGSFSCHRSASVSASWHGAEHERCAAPLEQGSISIIE